MVSNKIEGVVRLSFLIPWLKRNFLDVVIIKRISRAPIYHTRWQHRALYSNTNHTHTHTHTHAHTCTHACMHACVHTHTHTECRTRGWAGL